MFVERDVETLARLERLYNAMPTNPRWNDGPLEPGPWKPLPPLMRCQLVNGSDGTSTSGSPGGQSIMPAYGCQLDLYH